jgi:hypothetical protein
MTMRNVAFVIVALLAAVTFRVAAQSTPSLVDVAKTEEARRKAIKRPAKTYTNEDLRADITASRAINASPSEPTRMPSLNLPAGKAEEEPAKDQAYWSARSNAARAALDRSKVFADALQSRINALTTDFVNRDDPVQRQQLSLERQRAMAELDRVNKEIAEQTRAIADIQEEARQAGVPPGWLR